MVSLFGSALALYIYMYTYIYIYNINIYLCIYLFISRHFNWLAFPRLRRGLVGNLANAQLGDKHIQEVSPLSCIQLQLHRSSSFVVPRHITSTAVNGKVCFPLSIAALLAKLQVMMGRLSDDFSPSKHQSEGKTT